MPEEFILGVKPEVLFGQNQEFLFNGVLLIQGSEKIFFSGDGGKSPSEIDLISVIRRIGKGEFFPRKILEYDPTNPDVSLEKGSYTLPKYIQPVVWNIIYCENENGILYFVSDIPTKNIEDAGKAAELGGLVNLGWGGHINPRKERESASPLELIDFTGFFELHEELEIPVRIKDELGGLIYLQSDPVSVRHIGLWRMIKVDPRYTELTEKEKSKTINPRWISSPQILENQKLATWSKAIIEPLKKIGYY